MQRCALTPYEGKKPYIFVSYAHKDSPLVFPILEELDRRGYRVWYDDGIVPGSEWPENIAQHLDGCSLTLAFISPNSIASANCRREVTFALSKRKAFLGIVLQPTEMSLGMEMQLSAQQCIMKYTYASEEGFYQKLCSCPDMEPCLGQPKPMNVVVSTPAEPAPVVTSVQVAVPKQPKKEAKLLDKKWIPIIAAAAAAVVILAVVLGIVLSGGNDGSIESTPQGNQQTPEPPEQPEGSSSTTGGQENLYDETRLYFGNQTLNAEDIAHINLHTQLQHLEIYDCTFQEGALDGLKLSQTVGTITMVNCSGVDDLKFLADLKNLYSLRLDGCGITNELLPAMANTMLDYLDVSNNPAFTDLGIFAGCTGLFTVEFAATGVSSVEPLAGLGLLESINGSNSAVKDISPLCALEKLEQLRFANCGIETIDGVFNSLRLRELDLSGNMLTDLDAFAYCTVLETVDLSYGDFNDVDVLKKSAATLSSLNLGGNRYLYGFMMSWMSECTKLEELVLDGIDMGDFSLIANAVEMTYLSAVNCGIEDLSGLKNLTKLQYLNLALNSFSDISVLKGIAKDDMVLDLSLNSNLKDISALPDVEYEVLNLANDALNTEKMPALRGNAIILYYMDAWLEQGKLRQECSMLYIANCPMDKIVAMEDHFGQYSIQFLQTETAYLDALEDLGIDCTYLRAIANSMPVQ